MSRVQTEVVGPGWDYVLQTDGVFTLVSQAATGRWVAWASLNHAVLIKKRVPALTVNGPLGKHRGQNKLFKCYVSIWHNTASENKADRDIWPTNYIKDRIFPLGSI